MTKKYRYDYEYRGVKIKIKRVKPHYFWLRFKVKGKIVFREAFYGVEDCKKFCECSIDTRLGCSNEILNARKHINELIEPLWQKNLITREELYLMISDNIGKDYSNSRVHDIEEAREIYRLGLRIKRYLDSIHNPKPEPKGVFLV